MTNRRNQVDFAKSTFYFKISLFFFFGGGGGGGGGKCIISFYHMIQYVFFAIVCEKSSKNINFRVDFVYYFAWGTDV